MSGNFVMTSDTLVEAAAGHQCFYFIGDSDEANYRFSRNT